MKTAATKLINILQIEIINILKIEKVIGGIRTLTNSELNFILPLGQDLLKIFKPHLIH